MLSRKEKIKILKQVMDNETLYSIVCALRGSDLRCALELKKMYTNAVRAIARQSEHPVTAVLTRVHPRMVKIVLENIGQIEGAVLHFLDHIQSAFESYLRLGLIPKDIYNYILDTINAIKDARLETIDKPLIPDELIDKLLVKHIPKLIESYNKLYDKYLKEGYEKLIKEG